MEKLTPKRIFDKIAKIAGLREFLHGTSDGFQLKQILEQGKEIPDRLLPGRFLDKLTEEEREVLKGLTSDEVANTRPDSILFLHL